MWTVRYFKSKQYNWSGISQQPNLLAKAKRSLLQFTPYSWDNFDWRIFSSPKRCLQARGGWPPSKPRAHTHTHTGARTHARAHARTPTASAAAAPPLPCAVHLPCVHHPAV